jgi:uncharacterized membrane protein/thiol-disulfide isomerase/thioredoxin
LEVVLCVVFIVASGKYISKIVSLFISSYPVEVYVKSRITILFILLSLLVAFLGTSPVYAERPVIRAVLFFSPTCPHCRVVMEHTLPPLVEKYDGQLDIIGIDVSDPLGQELYQATITAFNIPDDRLGVPTLVVGDIILVGSGEIPTELPGIIEQGLANGGIDWPDIPGLSKVLSTQPTILAQESGESNPLSGQPVFVSRSNDLLANHIAVIVLLGMIACVFSVGYNFIKGIEIGYIRWPNWIVPLLAVAGLGVASYLSYVEATHTLAICGPVGNCNSVQQSPYAHLFGVISIGFFGLVGYSAILIAWILADSSPLPWRRFFTIAIWGMGWFGVLFSIYLTFLEPFVIGATCIWCITSAIIMTSIFLASTNMAIRALAIPESITVQNEEDDSDEVEQKEIDLNPDA